MSSARTKLKITGQPAAPSRPQALGSTAQGTVVALRPDGMIDVCGPSGDTVACAWLESSGNSGIGLSPGDAVLFSQHAEDSPAVVLGRIGLYGRAAPRIELQSGQTMSLKCGEASIDLRADGKVMIRGEDVLVRAKGTKRIRAGTVSIN